MYHRPRLSYVHSKTSSYRHLNGACIVDEQFYGVYGWRTHRQNCGWRVWYVAPLDGHAVLDTILVLRPMMWGRHGKDCLSMKSGGLISEAPSRCNDDTTMDVYQTPMLDNFSTIYIVKHWLFVLSGRFGSTLRTTVIMSWQKSNPCTCKAFGSKLHYKPCT